MNESASFARKVIESQRKAWEEAIKELDGGEGAWFFNGTDVRLRRIATHPEEFLARTPVSPLDRD